MNIAVLVSGGVDSSVALRLLQEQGHCVTAFYLKIWLEDELAYLGTCPWEEDLAYVKAVTDQAGVPLEILPFQREYWDEVVAYTIASVKAGLTPNPDIMCNKYIKFGAFLKALDKKYDAVASGHYAQRIDTSTGVELHCSPDAVKDQTYFLAELTQDQLGKALFPIGHLSKREVRAAAQRFDIPNKDRKDSQGICFLGKLKFSEFIRHHVGTKPGSLIDYETGAEIGMHEGFWYYTLGQRKGIGLSGGPWYVVHKDTDKNIVYVSKNYYAPDKERNKLTVKAVNWIGQVPEFPATLDVKLRHGAALHRAQVISAGSGVYTVHLDERDQGIAPGQYAVFYSDGRCLGGGVISED